MTWRVVSLVNWRRTSQRTRGGFLYGRYRPYIWPWIDSNGSEFSAICNNCGVMSAWNSKTLKYFLYFLSFFWKTTHYGKIFKILFRKFSSRHRSTCHVQISWNLADGKSVKPCVIYLTKNSPGSPAVAAVHISPKIYQGHPPTMYSECSRFHRNRYTFGRVITKRANTANKGLKWVQLSTKV